MYIPMDKCSAHTILPIVVSSHSSTSIVFHASIRVKCTFWRKFSRNWIQIHLCTVLSAQYLALKNYEMRYSPIGGAWMKIGYQNNSFQWISIGIAQLFSTCGLSSNETDVQSTIKELFNRADWTSLIHWVFGKTFLLKTVSRWRGSCFRCSALPMWEASYNQSCARCAPNAQQIHWSTWVPAGRCRTKKTVKSQ